MGGQGPLTRTPIKTPLSSKISNGSNISGHSPYQPPKPTFKNLLLSHRNKQNKQNLQQSLQQNLPSSLDYTKNTPFYKLARSENLVIETGPGSPFRTANRDRKLVQGICQIRVVDVVKS